MVFLFVPLWLLRCRHDSLDIHKKIPCVLHLVKIQFNKAKPLKNSFQGPSSNIIMTKEFQDFDHVCDKIFMLIFYPPLCDLFFTSVLYLCHLASLFFLSTYFAFIFYFFGMLFLAVTKPIKNNPSKIPPKIENEEDTRKRVMIRIEDMTDAQSLASIFSLLYSDLCLQLHFPSSSWESVGLRDKTGAIRHTRANVSRNLYQTLS